MKVTETLAKQNIRMHLKTARRNPEQMGIIAETIGKLEDGFFEAEYQDAIFQKWETLSEIEIEDAYCFNGITD